RYCGKARHRIVPSGPVCSAPACTDRAWPADCAEDTYSAHPLCWLPLVPFVPCLVSDVVHHCRWLAEPDSRPGAATSAGAVRFGLKAWSTGGLLCRSHAVSMHHSLSVEPDRHRGSG